MDQRQGNETNLSPEYSLIEVEVVLGEDLDVLLGRRVRVRVRVRVRAHRAVQRTVRARSARLARARTVSSSAQRRRLKKET